MYVREISFFITMPIILLLSAQKFKLNVFGMISKQSKILNTIIVANSVDMMNRFSWLKESAQVLFHHQSMFVDTTNLVRRWATFLINNNIAVRRNVTTLPPTMLLTVFHVLNYIISITTSLLPSSSEVSTCVTS